MGKTCFLDLAKPLSNTNLTLNEGKNLPLSLLICYSKPLKQKTSVCVRMFRKLV